MFDFGTITKIKEIAEGGEKGYVLSDEVSISELKPESQRPKSWFEHVRDVYRKAEPKEKSGARAVVELTEREMGVEPTPFQSVVRAAETYQPVSEDLLKAGFMPVYAAWDRLRSVAVAAIEGESIAEAALRGGKRIKDVEALNTPESTEKIRTAYMNTAKSMAKANPMFQAALPLIEEGIGNMSGSQLLLGVDISADILGMAGVKAGVEALSTKAVVVGGGVERQKLTQAYDTLGVKEGASGKEILSAYRKATLKFHPDKGGNPQDFIRITDAFRDIKTAMGTAYFNCGVPVPKDIIEKFSLTPKMVAGLMRGDMASVPAAAIDALQGAGFFEQFVELPKPEPLDPLLEEARKYKTAEEFVNFMRGSATQYREYNPKLRATQKLFEDSARISELGIDPEMEVTIYRGVPDPKNKKIVDGDFVVTDIQSAESYAGKDNVISKKVKAKDLIVDSAGDFNADNPFGLGAEFIYSDSKNKLDYFTDKQLTDIWNKAQGAKGEVWYHGGAKGLTEISEGYATKDYNEALSYAKQYPDGGEVYKLDSSSVRQATEKDFNPEVQVFDISMLGIARNAKAVPFSTDKAQEAKGVEEVKPKKKVTVKKPEPQIIKQAVKSIENIKSKIDSVDKLKDLTAEKNELTAILNKSRLIPTDERQKLVERIKFMRDKDKFKNYLDYVSEKIQSVEKRREIAGLIRSRQYKKVDNLRKAMKLPSLVNMKLDQLTAYETELNKYEQGDIFLTQRQLETVDRTDLAGIKTLREAREKLAIEVGVPIEELNKIKVSELDRFRYDVALAEQNPFYDLLVTEYHKNVIQSDLKYMEFERELNNLTTKARKSRERGLWDKAIPTDERVFDYLSSPNKAELAKDMTKEELDLAVFLQEKFSGALEYLIQNEALTTGRENYITNVRRGALEAVKQDGLIEAFKEILDQYKQDFAVFNILDQATDEILPLDKFFQFAMQRKGGLKPTKNVAKAASIYFKTMFKKQAIDAFIPKMMIYVDSLTPTKLTPRGLEFDQSLRKFVKEWINTKKGRKRSLLIQQGGTLDVVTSGVKAFISIMDLGLNVPVGIAANVGEAVATFATLGNKQTASGVARLATKKGKTIVEKYEGFVGRTVWRELLEPSKNIGDKSATLLFGLFNSSSTRANKIGLLGLMTEQEFQAGEISEGRLAEIRLKMGRLRMQPGMKGVFESTTEGGILTQYKTWAIPILRTTGADIVNFSKKLKSGEAMGSVEMKELLWALEITLAAVAFGAMLGDTKKGDKSFSAQLIQKVRRESLTLLGAIDPEMMLGEPRMISWLADLGKAIKQLVTLEKYKEEKRAGELKGLNALGRMVVPRALKTLIPGEETTTKTGTLKRKGTELKRKGTTLKRK